MNQLSKYREGRRLLDGATTGAPRPARISIDQNKFTLIDPAGEKTEVPFQASGAELYIVPVDRNEHTSKLYWGPDRNYDRNNATPSPPLCFSDNGVAPSSAAQEPQHPTCADCRHNIWGSATSALGSKVKACQDMKKFAVVVHGYPGVYLFVITPGSFRNWNAYTTWLRMQRLADGGQPDLSDIVIKLRFEGQGVLQFEGAGLVEDGSDLAKQVIDIWEANKTSDQTGMMVGRYDQPAQGVLPAPQQEQAPSAKKAEPPPLQGQGLFFKPAQPAEEPPKRVRAKKDEERAPIEPSPPVPPKPKQAQGVQAPQAGSPPHDVASRLNSLFKLPTMK